MTLKFVDRSFNAHPARAREIWKFCAQHTSVTNFHFEIHPLFLEDEDYSILRDIPDKAFRFEIGIQSVNEESLHEIHRKVSWDKISPKIQRLVALKNINIHCDLIAGLPFETIDDISKSFNEILSLKPHHLQLGFLKVLPGTVMYDKADEYEMISMQEPPYQVLQTKWFSHEDMATVRRIENLVENIYNGGLHYIIEELSEYKDMFTLYRKCANYCVATGFNLSTRNVAKTKTMLLAFKDYLRK
jgi:radical SAM superfamily enzyme